MMSKHKIISIVLIAAFMISGCEKDSDAIQISLLEKSWTQSYEENISESYIIYRPSDYKDFPPSRYRQVYIFRDNKNCEYLILAPNDAHYMENGNWEYDAKNNIIKVMNSDFIVLYEFEIIELKDDLLKLKSQ